MNRRTLLRAGASAALVTAVDAAVAEGASLRGRDRSIVQFALVLEELQAAFYTEAERVGALAGQVAELARVVGGHERAHVRAVRAILGADAAEPPAFDFQGATESRAGFVRTAVAFEDLGVAAYKGEMTRIRSRGLLATVLAIHAVEARHAAWIRRVAGVLPAATAFDRPRSQDAVTRIVRSTQFVVSSSGRSVPGFTG